MSLLIEICLQFAYIHDTNLKKRMRKYAEKYPDLCQQADDDEQGGKRVGKETGDTHKTATRPINKTMCPNLGHIKIWEKMRMLQKCNLHLKH